MSMNFDDPMQPETKQRIKKLFGDGLTAIDDHTALFENTQLVRDELKAALQAEKQPVSVEIHEDGDIKTMSDGTRYQVTKRGWVKLD